MTDQEIKKRQEEFEAVARPMIKWLCENMHPHVTVIVTPTSAELNEGLVCINQVHDYLID